MAYLLDANIFIQAKNFHYGMDFCPAFWDWLEKENQSGKVFSIHPILKELVAGNDELSKWAALRGGAFFKEIDEDTEPNLNKVSEWAKSKNYGEDIVSNFLGVADYYLISYAITHKHTVVTHERLDNNTKKIKIPNVCEDFGIKCIDPYKMLRDESAKFVL